jgi:hypothetical protein
VTIKAGEKTLLPFLVRLLTGTMMEESATATAVKLAI